MRRDVVGTALVLDGADDGTGEPCVYFGSLPRGEAARFGVRHLERTQGTLVRFTCGGPVWTDEELSVLGRFASRELGVPCEGRWRVVLDPLSPAEVLLADAEGSPLVLRKGRSVWCALDLAHSLSLLMTERYLPDDAAPGAVAWLATWRPLQKLYYRAPRRLRARLQQRVIRALDQKLAGGPADRFRTSYPVDATGWALLRVIANVVEMAAGPQPVVPRWPEPFQACVVVTHDIEPTSFAYREGADRLFRWLEERGAPPHTVNPVASEARRVPALWTRSDVRRNELGCHGWLHDGRETRLPRGKMLERIRLAKATVESLGGTRVSSFRSPRLDRSETLYDVVDASGFTCDSTVPDADRENTDRWGAGCSLNFPFHPIVRDGGGHRRLHLLECPVTAPDCAMPVFAGSTEADAVALYARKLDWVQAIGGSYVAIFHGGVFDRSDAGMRERLLGGFCDALEGRPVWRPTLGELERWWRVREQALAPDADSPADEPRRAVPPAR